jgi:hypothetical protein
MGNVGATFGPFLVHLGVTVRPLLILCLGNPGTLNFPFRGKRGLQNLSKKTRHVYQTHTRHNSDGATQAPGMISSIERDTALKLLESAPAAVTLQSFTR